jgi:hypothetical protein
MKMVLRDAKEFIGEGDDEFQSGYKKKMFQKYKRWEQVLEHFTKGLPISLVVLRNGFIGAVVNDRELWKIVPIRLLEFVSEHAGLNYFRVELFERDPMGGVTRNIVNHGRHAAILHYVLLLPLLCNSNYEGPYNDTTWTMVGSEYERLGSNGTLQSVYDLPINLRETPVETGVTEDNQEVLDWADGVADSEDANEDPWDDFGVV